MSITYDENGIVIQTLSEILDEREQKLREILGSDFIISGDSPIGNLQLADADRELSIQELILYLASQMNPDTAEGMWLDFICALSYIYRNSPTYTNIPITISGTVGATVDAEALTIVDETTNRYYVNKEYFIVGVDGTVDVTFRCTDYGLVYASPSSTYNIKTPISGITSIAYKNGGTTTVGSDTETDAHLRARREDELESRASSTLASIKATVTEVPEVTFVQCYENDTSATVDGIPTKSFEVVVKGGNDISIAKAILTKKAAGIQAYGTTTETIQDSDGNNFTIGFTRPTDVPVAIQIDMLVTATQPADWITDIKNALASKFIASFDVGDDDYVYPLYSSLTNYKEILNITNFQIKKVTNGTWAESVTIANREVGTLSVSNITINQSTS